MSERACRRRRILKCQYRVPAVVGLETPLDEGSDCSVGCLTVAIQVFLGTLPELTVGSVGKVRDYRLRLLLPNLVLGAFGKVYNEV